MEQSTMDKETFLSRGMARIKRAIVDAPSHLEIEAGFEALLRHLHDPYEDPEATDPKDPSAARMAATSVMHAQLASKV